MAILIKSIDWSQSKLNGKWWSPITLICQILVQHWSTLSKNGKEMPQYWKKMAILIKLLIGHNQHKWWGVVPSLYFVKNWYNIGQCWEKRQGNATILEENGNTHQQYWLATFKNKWWVMVSHHFISSNIGATLVHSKQKWQENTIMFEKMALLIKNNVCPQTKINCDWGSPFTFSKSWRHSNMWFPRLISHRFIVKHNKCRKDCLQNDPTKLLFNF